MVTCVRVCSHNRLILLIMFLQFIFMIESYIPFVYLFTSVCFDLITLSMYIQQSYQADWEKKRENEGRGRYTLIEFHIFMDELHFIDGVLARRLDFWSIAWSNAKHKKCYVSSYLMRYCHKNVQAIFQYFNSWMNLVGQMTRMKWSFRSISWIMYHIPFRKKLLFGLFVLYVDLYSQSTLICKLISKQIFNDIKIKILITSHIEMKIIFIIHLILG